MTSSYSSSPEAPSCSFNLQRLPLWGSSIRSWAFVGGFLLFSQMAELVNQIRQNNLDVASVYSLFGLAILWLFGIGGILAKRVWVRRQTLAPIQLLKYHMLLPKHAEDTKSHVVLYTDILSLEDNGNALNRQICIETKKQVFELPASMFVHPDEIAQMLQKTYQRIANSTHSISLLELTQQQRAPTVLAMQRQAFGTQFLLGTLGVFFLNTYLKNAFDTPFGLLRWGANAKILVAQGEVFRLLAANFLHGGFAHILMNGLALHYLGNIVERLLGWQRFALIYLCSAVLAMLTSYTWSDALMTVGASGAIFGLLGSMAVLTWRLKHALPPALRQPGQWWIWILVVNTMLQLLWPSIDLSAHVGGFLAGGLLTFLILGTHRQIPTEAHRSITYLACGLVGLSALALGQAVYHAATDPQNNEDLFAEHILQDPHTSARNLNNVAWLWALDEHTSKEQLQIAATASLQAIQKDPNIAAYHDTWATIASRQGNLDEAIVAERRALALSGADPVVMNQLADFYQLQLTQQGPQLAADINLEDIEINLNTETKQIGITKMPTNPGILHMYILLDCNQKKIAFIETKIATDTTLPATYSDVLLRYLLMNQTTGCHLQIAMAEIDAKIPGDKEAETTVEWLIAPILSTKS